MITNAVETATLPPGCEVRCPGCAQRSLSEEESEARNNAWLARELAPWASAMAPILSPKDRWGYRRKVLLHARREAGAWAFGMIRMRGREEEFVPIPNCPLHHPVVNKMLAFVSVRLPADWPISYALVSGGALTLVLKMARRAEWLPLLEGWQTNWPGDALWVNWNPVAGKHAVDSRRNELVFGEEWLEDRGLCHGPSAFRQQIPELAERALTLAEEYLSGAGLGVVADFYCGLGASLARWRARGWAAVGVELSGESVAAAERNAPGARILRGRTEDRLPQIEEFLDGRDFVAYTNPPRSGHGEEALEWLLARRPARLAYLSCHPRSLAGDLARLTPAFRVAGLWPMDFFPQTGHVETLALLRRE